LTGKTTEFFQTENISFTILSCRDSANNTSRHRNNQ